MKIEDDPDFAFLPQSMTARLREFIRIHPDTKLYGVKTLESGVTDPLDLGHHPRFFSEDTKKKMAMTAIDVPININHHAKFSGFESDTWTLSGENIVIDSDYINGKIVMILGIQDSKTQMYIDAGNFAGPSIEFGARKENCYTNGTTICEQLGVRITGLALITKPHLPGDLGGTITKLEMNKGEPFGPFSNWDDCMNHPDMVERYPNEESRRNICGNMKAQMEMDNKIIPLYTLGVTLRGVGEKEKMSDKDGQSAAGSPGSENPGQTSSGKSSLPLGSDTKDILSRSEVERMIEIATIKQNASLAPCKDMLESLRAEINSLKTEFIAIKAAKGASSSNIAPTKLETLSAEERKKLLNAKLRGTSFAEVMRAYQV